jgi:drug/metabolite transporter (DMT)-like permease
VTAAAIHHNAARGILFAVTATCFYALVPNLARFGVLAGVPALEAVTARTLIIAIVLGVAALLTGRSFAIPRAAWAPFAGQTLATLAVSACYIGSLQFISVGLSVLIFFTFPVIVILLSPLVEGRRLTALEAALAIVAFAGLALALAPSFQSVNGIGIGLAGLAAIGCALQFYTGRALSPHMHPMVFGSLVHFAMLPFVIALALGSHGRFELLQPGLSSLAIATSVGLGLAYCAGYFCQMSAVHSAPASIVIPYFNLEPVMTTLLAVIFLKEGLTPLHLAGGALVIGSLFALTFLRRRTSETPRTPETS